MGRKIILGVLILMSVTCLMPKIVFADDPPSDESGEGGASEGGNADGGTCDSDLFNSCNGYSWQKYKITAETENLPSGGLTLSTHQNITGSSSINYCKKDQIIYNFGFEIRRETIRGYQVATISNLNGEAPRVWANWVYASQDRIRSDAPSAKGSFINGTNGTTINNFYNGNIQNYTTPEGYATHKEAYDRFYTMYDYATRHKDETIPGIDINKGFDDNWESTGAFCWDEKKYNNEEEPEAKFLANSKAQVSKATGSAMPRTAETGISIQDKEVSTTLAIKVGESAKIVFNHNIYASEKVDAPKGWRIERDFSAGVTMGAGATPTSGYVKFSNLGTDFFGGKRLYNADKSPIFTETYNNITFNNQGHYRFCESITVDNTITTRVCINIDVTKKDAPECTGTECECYGTNCPTQPQQPCGFAVPGSYSSSSSTSGTTSVISKVRNLSLSNVYGGFQGVIYAKPGDTVNWCNAYYPGVQKAANATVTINNYDPEPTNLSGFTNTLTNGVFSDYSDWTNQFSITSVNVRPYYSESPSFGIGNSDPQSSSNSTSIGTDQVGQTLSETITSGSPATASVSSGSGPHTWACHWKEEDKRCGVKETITIMENPHFVSKPNPLCNNDDKPPTIGIGGTVICLPIIEIEWDEREEYIYNSCYVDTCRHTNLFYSNSHGGTASDTSYVQVPYNFRNTATVNIRDSLVYAGETMTIGSATVTVGGKQNDTTQGFYATRVDNAQTKLVGYLSSSSTGAAKDNLNSSNICSALPVKNGSCNELNSYSGMTLNSGSSNMSGSTSALGFAGQSYNVYDATAGDYYCVVAAVYPSTSGSDTNLAASGDGRWYVSAPSCRVVAKRPSFQVWGGSIYLARAAKTSNALKASLWNVPGYGYTTTDKRNTVVFGSWVEQAVISNGIVTGLASGAATGNVFDARQAGSKESGANYCTYRVPLSIANWSTSTFGGSICPNVQAVGNAGLSNAALDRDALMDYWNVSNASYINKAAINLASDYIETTTMQGNRVNYTEVSGSISQASLAGATIRKGITHVVRVSGNLRIDGNIVYENTNYSSQKEIPKLLIYASGNIVINCGVSRIDAIIIAGGQVKTCDSDNSNARANFNQLKINGMVIADKLIPNRSYGAWAGTGSGVPAEIINYDTSAIVWGKSMAAGSDFDTLTTVYQHEIAPRY